MTAETPHEYDCFAEETFTSPHEEFARLRQECPVAHSNDFGGFWIATRYDDVVSMLQDSENYITSVRNIVPSSSSTARTPPLHFDPPHHTPYRKALDRALSRGRVASLTPSIHKHSAELIDKFIALGEGDFVEHVGSWLPILVFGDWMGLTEEQTNRLWQLGRTYIRAWVDFDVDRVMQTVAGFAEIANEVVADRRANPRDPELDPTSSLMATILPDGSKIPDELLASSVRQVLVVGLTAPPMVFSSMAVYLAQNPDLYARLHADPTLAMDAMEEFLRLFTPYRGFARTSKKEVEWYGRTIKPGEPIALAFASANRDETVFKDPDQFKLHRPNIGKHVAFGMGPHRCVGMPIARLEMGIGLQTLLAKVSSIELIGNVRMSGMPEIGPITAPIRVTAA